MIAKQASALCAHREAILNGAHPDGIAECIALAERRIENDSSSGKDNIKISGGDAAVGHTRSHSEHEG